MRRDENGNLCPETLGEYRDLCAALGTEQCEAARWLDGKIADAPRGRDEIVIASDLQMRMLLFPMLGSTVTPDTLEG